MRERTIFIEALERADPADRAGFLDAACDSDPELRRRVERLLRRHEETGDLLDTPPAGPAPVDAEVAGARVGPYELRGKLGEGGMGAVYLAEQVEPVRRQVALKVVRPGMDTEQVLARFDAERQALACMDHPNIARVLDAGSTGEGRPYFVMELVDGQPITAYCDAHRLALRERLELFVPVCEAIQHAHRKGVIHRDIKPSNVLVATAGGRPSPKVIDFGIAKATDGPLTDRALATEAGSVLGTLEYMSPEQAAAVGRDVDTRSDVYALGVLLYELVAGCTPLDPERLRAAGLPEALRLVRDEEPARPSARLGRARADLAALAHRRRAEPSRLAAAVGGELDWIAMKALEKDRGRRYESPGALARDVRNHLDGAAVAACPPTAGYRLRKFLRRHGRRTLAAGLLLAASVGVGVSLFWNLELSVQKAISRDVSDNLRQDYERVRAAAKRAIGEMAEAGVGLRPGGPPAGVRADLLGRAERFYEELVRLQRPDRRPAPDLGEAYGWLGFVKAHAGRRGEALADFERMRGYFRRVPYDFAGDAPTQAAALEALRVAVRHQEALAAEHPAEPRLRESLARSHAALGSLLADQGRDGDAGAEFRRALEVAEAAALAHPSDARCQSCLGWLLSGCPDGRLRDPARALGAARRAAGLAPRDPDVGRALATVLYRAGEWPAAASALEAGLRLRPPGAPGAAGDRLLLALAQRRAGRTDEASRNYRAARAALPAWPPGDDGFDLAWLAEADALFAGER